MMNKEQQFILDRVDIQIDTGCWLWNKATNTGGYGYTGNCTLWRKYGTALAHRLSYTVFKEPVHADLYVRHKCRNIRCCNPEHLEPGTALDNNRDKVRDGTNNLSLGNGFTAANHSGEKNHMAKLSKDEVAKIKQLREQQKLKYRELAEMFEVSIATIGYICKGQVWQHV